jgi:hypothetical protein
MTRIHIVIWKDRHADTTVHPFTDLETAISEAKRMAKKYSRAPEDYEERKIPGWDFYASYSCEGCHTRVVTVDLDKEIS